MSLRIPRQLHLHSPDRLSVLRRSMETSSSSRALDSFRSAYSNLAVSFSTPSNASVRAHLETSQT